MRVITTPTEPSDGIPVVTERRQFASVRDAAGAPLPPVRWGMAINMVCTRCNSRWRWWRFTAQRRPVGVNGARY